MRIIPFEPRPRQIQTHSRAGITGLFWAMPESWQRQRIRELAATLSPETISTIARRSYKETVSIIEGQP